MVLNPYFVGALVEESGSIEAGKLVWSDKALSQLFFRGSVQPTKRNDASRNTNDDKVNEDYFVVSWELLTIFPVHELRDKEEELAGERVTLCFGWAKDFERLCILGVEW